MIYIAAGLALLTFFIHTFSGGKAVARPLLADTSLDAPVKWLSYYCWHIATLLLLSMTLAFTWIGYANAVTSSQSLLVFLAALSAALSVLSIRVALKAAINPLKFPSTVLFALIAIATTLALAGY